MPTTTLSDEDVSTFTTCTDTFNKTALAADGEDEGWKVRILKTFYFDKIVGQTLNMPAALPPVPAGPR